MFTFQESGLPLFSVVAWRSNTNQGQKKASLRVSMEAVRMALTETQREASAHALFLCNGVVSLETSHISIDDRFAAMQIVMVTKRLLRLYSFQSVVFSSFHCLVTDVKNYVIAGSRSRTGNETNLTPFSLS